jgi:hypothetical protein
MFYIWDMCNYKWVINAFKTNADEEEIRQSIYYKSLTWQKWLKLANYLNSVFYGFPEDDPPRIDKAVFFAGTNDEVNRLKENLKK